MQIFRNIYMYEHVCVCPLTDCFSRVIYKISVSKLTYRMTQGESSIFKIKRFLLLLFVLLLRQQVLSF